MSAIWGQVKLGGAVIDKNRTCAMDEQMKGYKLDKIDRVCTDKVYFACGHQYITPESEREQLPYYDEAREIYFTADCILDNRQELIDKMHIKEQGIPDGMLCYCAYLEWGERFAEELLGIFSLAIYDERNSEFLLFTDHTGSRCINYCVKEETIVFSTTTRPITHAAFDKSIKLCEKWMSACEAYMTSVMIVFPGLTPFEDVYQLEAGHYIKIVRGKLTKIRYWNPVNTVKDIHLASDDEYKQLFLETFKRCVEDTLRSSGKTAVSLSGGLDSTSVACMAAAILAVRGENLYSYTSVPVEGYVSDGSRVGIENESEGVRLVAERYSNIVPELVSCEGKNEMDELEYFVRYLEVPEKSHANFVWINEIQKRARANDCRIILEGQYGNFSISYGNIVSLAYQRLLKGNIKGAKTAITDFMRRFGIPKKNMIKILSADVIKKFRVNFNDLGECFVRKDLLNKYNIKAAYKKSIKAGSSSTMASHKQYRKIVCMPQAFQQIGMYNTKFGLLNGIIVRDPTKDKRMLELCMGLPIECFADNGIERRMVRKYMKDIVPGQIRANFAGRGIQAADFTYRLSTKWSKYKERILEYFKREEIYRYLDKSCVDELAEKIAECDGIEKYVNAQYITAISSLSVFLRDNK